MTPEEIKEQIEQNRRIIREVHGDVMRQRAVETLSVETEALGESDIPEEELEAHRYVVTADGTAAEF